jgi:hypothetical protein
VPDQPLLYSNKFNQGAMVNSCEANQKRPKIIKQGPHHPEKGLPDIHNGFF